MIDPMVVDPAHGNAEEAEDTREAPWTVTEFFLDPRRYNPSAEILHKAANVSRWTVYLVTIALWSLYCTIARGSQDLSFNETVQHNGTRRFPDSLE